MAVPVKAYPATSTTDAIHFNQLHAPCRQRIRYEKHCPIHGKVDAAEIVKGYPYAPDQYVVIEDAELERLRLTRQDWADLARRLPARTRQQPIVPCRKQAVWLEPELYCRVRTLGWTRAGRLRGASFAGLIAR